MKINRPIILLTNDDGIFSPALLPLAKELSRIGEVTVVAPENEKSAISHSITITQSLRITKANIFGEMFGYAVSGTPVDCIKLGLGTIMKRKPDLVISGINIGLNTGIFLKYSGTVCAAIEAAASGIPSLAVSMDTRKGMNFTFPSIFIARLSKLVLERGLPEDTLLNINFPSGFREDIKGIALTRQGKMKFQDSLEKRLDPRNNSYYWLRADYIPGEDDDSQDFVAIDEGKISITPIQYHYDLTNYHYLDSLKTWDIVLD